MQPLVSPSSPQLSPWPPANSHVDDSAVAFYARAYGTHMPDLDIDLHASDQLSLITQLLSSFLLDEKQKNFSPAQLWQWSLKQRTQGLLAILLASGHAELPLTLRCVNQACDELLEFHIPISDLVDIDHADTVSCEMGEQQIILRLPTGEDQLNWSSMKIKDESDIYNAIIESLLVSGADKSSDIPDCWIPVMEQQLQTADQFTNFSISSQCPTCQTHQDIEVDLESVVIAQLARIKARLLQQIHIIALHYHWNESEIIALPKARREIYVDKLLNEALI